MDITFGIDEIRIPGKHKEIYVHEIAARNLFFTCDGERYSISDVAHMSGITTQRIKGAIEGARALRGLNSKIFEQCRSIADLVRDLDDPVSKDIRTILANRKVRG